MNNQGTFVNCQRPPAADGGDAGGGCGRRGSSGGRAVGRGVATSVPQALRKTTARPLPASCRRIGSSHNTLPLKRSGHVHRIFFSWRSWVTLRLRLLASVMAALCLRLSVRSVVLKRRATTRSSIASSP